MVRAWERHNHRKPCPVCFETKKGCRTNKENNITHCRGNTSSRDYRFLKEDKHGFWMYKKESEINEFSEAKKQEWLEEKRLEKERREREWQQQLEAGLSPQERDRAIREILNELSLSDEHKKKLHQRGLSDEQIKNAGYRSVTQWQRLNQPVTPALAGVNRYGTGLVTPDSGILVPIPNEKGLWVGYQVRRDNPDDGNKYLWSASEQKREPRPTVHTKDGELPLGVWGEASQDGVVGLCESTGIKPYIASLRLGIPFIGAAGANFTSSPTALTNALTALTAKKIIIYPDAGAAINPHIHQQLINTANFLSERGYDVMFAWWGQIEKSNGDIDEISPETLESAIVLISPNEFVRKALPDEPPIEEWEEPPQDEYQAYTQQLEEEEKVAEAQKERDREQWRENYPIAAKNSYKRLKRYTPDIRINKPFINSDDFPQEDNVIVGIKSGLGTNKSGAVADLFQALPDDQGALAPNHRNNLGIQSANRWGFDHLQTKKAQGEPIQSLISDTTSRIICCFDSLIKFRPEDFDDRYLVLDEGSGSTLHLLTSNTAVAGYLEETLELFKEAVKRAKRVIVLDGMLTDSVIAYISKLAPEKKVIKIQNDFENPIKLHHFVGTQDIRENEPIIKPRDRAPLVDRVSYSECPVVVSDSQLFCASMAKMLSKELGEGLQIDSTTMGEPWAKEFMSDPDAYIRKHKPKWLVLSPSCESGVNIALRDYFTELFGFFFGAILCDAMHQMLFRVRDESLHRFFWCNEFDTKSEQLRSPFPKQNLKNHEQFLLLDIQNAFENGEDPTELFREFCQMRQDNPHSDMWSKLEAIHNYEKRNLRTSLVESLESKGHKIMSFTEPDTALLKQEKHLKDEVKEEYATAIFYAEDIDSSEIEYRKQKGKFEDQCAVRKKLIKIKLPGIEKTQIWNEETVRLLEYDDRDRIRHLQRYWLFNHLEEAQRLQQKRWEKIQDGIISKYHLRSDYTKIKALIDAGIETFLTEEDKEWKADDAEVQDFFNNCKKWDFKLAFGKAPGRKSQPMQWLNTCLKFFGYKTRERKRSINGERFRVYRIIPLLESDPINPTLYECVKLYFTEIIERDKEATAQAKSDESAKSTQPQSESDSQGDPPLPYGLNKNSQGGSPLSTEKKEGGSPLAESHHTEENTDSSPPSPQFEQRDRAFRPTDRSLSLNGFLTELYRNHHSGFRYCFQWQDGTTFKPSLDSPEATELAQLMASANSRQDIKFIDSLNPYSDDLRYEVWLHLLSPEAQENYYQLEHGLKTGGEPAFAPGGNIYYSSATDCLLLSNYEAAA
jgi:hypothetical protein